MKIISTNLGTQKEIDWKGKIVTTGIFKVPVKTSVFLNTENVKNDVICNREHHGGIDQAVYAYSAKHYDFFKPNYPNLNWQYGIFGENLTLDTLDETKIHQDDIFTVGEAILQATKPRKPCMKLGVRFNDMKIVKQFWNSTFCGVYFKVLQTGFVAVGDRFKKIKSYSENPTIAALYSAQRKHKGIT